MNTNLRAEKVRSAVADDIGTVRASQRSPCIDESNSLKLSLSFMASHIVWIEVTVLTVGRAVFTAL